MSVAQFIKETYPCLRIIVWDDMLRSIELQVLNGIFIQKLWQYLNSCSFAKNLVVFFFFSPMDRILYREIRRTDDLALQLERNVQFATR